MRDCIFLVADKNMQTVFREFFKGEQWWVRLGCGRFAFEPGSDLRYAAGGNDPGLYDRAHELLRSYTKTHRHAVVVLDAEWEGAPSPAAIRDGMRARLVESGWATDAVDVVVIVPEMENWIWIDSPYVAQTFGYQGAVPLRDWLAARGFWEPGASKPSRPKEAVQCVLDTTRKPRSSALYGAIISKSSLRRCTDGAFRQFRETLADWYPSDQN